MGDLKRELGDLEGQLAEAMVELRAAKTQVLELTQRLVAEPHSVEAKPQQPEIPQSIATETSSAAIPTSFVPPPCVEPQTKVASVTSFSPVPPLRICPSSPPETARLPAAPMKILDASTVASARSTPTPTRIIVSHSVSAVPPVPATVRPPPASPPETSRLPTGQNNSRPVTPMMQPCARMRSQPTPRNGSIPRSCATPTRI